MKRLSCKMALVAMVMLSLGSASAQTPLWQGKGRIVISSDGNEHDSDDWSATAMSLALLAARGMQNDLVLYTYSDHVWGSNQARARVHGKSAYEHMRESALGGKSRFGFDKSRFICAVDCPERAYDAMAEVINQSTAENPLIILAGGPMQVVGEGLNRAKKECREFVTVVSHSWWNNEHSDWWSDDIDRPFPSLKAKSWDGHSGWTFAEMKSEFGTKRGGEAKFIEILDQNGGDDYEGLQAPMSRFEWLITFEGQNKPPYSYDSWYWLYERLLVHGHKGKFDVSDAGLVLYMLTGVEKSNVDMLREIMENPVVKRK
ncbi:MAG: hypothetical protein SNG14_02135 [Rikenellaceae bacterium]